MRGHPLAICVAALGVAMLGPSAARAQPRTALAEQIDLARLVDLAAQQAGVAVEYDPARVQGRVSVRGHGELPPDELWSLMNRTLLGRGLTTVRLPGQDGALVIVPLNDAAGLARVEALDSLPSSREAGSPGFAVARHRLQFASPERVLEGVKAVLSRPVGTVSAVGDSRVVLIADTLARLEQARDLVRELDGASADMRLVSYRPVARESAGLVAHAIAVAARASEAGLGVPRGSVQSDDTTGEVMILAEPADVARWEAILRQLDRPGRRSTVGYSSAAYGLEPVSRLIEDVLGALDAGGGSTGPWTVVRDDLTGTLFVTGDERHHAAVGDVLERLESAPLSSRRAVRHFAVRHRAVGDVVRVLEPLLSAERDGPSARQGEVDSQRSAGGEDALVEASHESVEAYSDRTDPGRGEPDVVLATDDATNTLIAVGEPRVISQIEELLRTIDVRQPQVMLEVVLVSLSDAQTRSLGVELAGLIKTGEVRVRLASLFGLSTIANGLPGGGVGGAGGTVSVLAPEDFAIVLRALETVNQGRSLSNPRVLVGNGQQASLNSTLGQPVTSVNASDTVATTSFAGFSDAGTQVSITPRIAAGDHLLLEYSITLSAFVGESPGAGIPPPRQQNQLQSVVSIPDGYTVVVGGIELATEGESENRVPLLGQIPIIREAFRSRNWNENRQRFFVFIRAEVDRGRSFEGLRHVSEGAMEEAGVENWPVVDPRLVR